ncbi:MAG: hypothetical protein KDA84_01760, partial [Planctomycetaceae bacterium]|nr:hypothetical protein [Planctomycetaceae bacterium]
QTVDATFQKQAHLPIAINGIIAKPGEEDRYLLNVTPGQKLRFTVEARTLPSPLDALLTVRNHPQGNVVVYKEDSGSTRDPQADFTVPANVKQIQVGVQDLHERGDRRFVYRLIVAPTNLPDFSLKLKSPTLTLPAEGTGVVEMQLVRRGYNGPIKLRAETDDSISIIPDQIPAGKGNRDLFVLLDRKAQGDDRGFRPLNLIAESVGLKPEITRYAEVGAVALSGQETLLPVFVGPPAPLDITVANVPPVLFKGVPVEIPLTLKPRGETKLPPTVRLDLLTTEPERPNDPKDPKKGNKPKIHAPEYQAIPIDAKQGTLKITVPVDVAVNETDAIVKAELVRHAYSSVVGGTAYSQPFKFSIQTAATVTLDKKTFDLKASQAAKIKGTLKRTKGFEEPVTLSVVGLPKGYQTSEVTVPAGQTSVEIPITPGKETAAKTVKVSVVVKGAGGESLLPDQAVELKIQPAK